MDWMISWFLKLFNTDFEQDYPIETRINSFYDKLCKCTVKNTKVECIYFIESLLCPKKFTYIISFNSQENLMR